MTRDLEDAENFLRNGDEVMNVLISRHGPCVLSETKHSLFHTLVKLIISQQLSSKAADTISNRLESIVGMPFFPSTIYQTSDKILKSAGISDRKTFCIKEISKLIMEKDFSFDDLDLKSNEEIILSLTKLSGIGRWTAEMFLIFGFKRLDVFSQADAGLRRAIKFLYSNSSGKELDLLSLSEKWRPYRSVASWYLWRSLDSSGSK